MFVKFCHKEILKFNYIAKCLQIVYLEMLAVAIFSALDRNQLFKSGRIKI